MKKKNKKINIKNIIKFILLLSILLISIFFIINLKITNIYIKGNTYYSDQDIIDKASLRNYPNTFIYNTLVIKYKLEKDLYISNVKVSKKGLTKVYIEVEETYPLFYNTSSNLTVMSNLSVNNNVVYPTLINYVPDTIYLEFIESMKKIDKDILNRISEIKYDPNDVDDRRFLLTMNDGNFVFINIIRFNNLNMYQKLITKLMGKKGILYLDSGEYFKIIED